MDSLKAEVLARIDEVEDLNIFEKQAL